MPGARTQVMPWNHAAQAQIECDSALPKPAAREGRRSELDERCGSHLERGCLMEAAVVVAVTTKCRGEWRERVVDCADAREKRARAKVWWVGVSVFGWVTSLPITLRGQITGPGALAWGRRPKHVCIGHGICPRHRY